MHACNDHFCDIEEKYKREVRIISIDFYGGQNVYPTVTEQLNDLDIGILGKLVACFIMQLLIISTFSSSISFVYSLYCILLAFCCLIAVS